jgi:hypothetical protein
VVTGLFGLDSRHGSYSEIHPVFGLALQEDHAPGFSRWLLLARNGGSEGACSGHRMHWLSSPPGRITLRLPLPTLNTAVSTTGSYYSANFTATPSVHVSAAGAFADVTVQLPPPPHYGVVAGELVLQSPGLSAAKHVLPSMRTTAPAALPLRVPSDLEEPEQLLASLAGLLPPVQRAALKVPVAPGQRQPLSAEQACRLLDNAGPSPQAQEHPLQLQLAKQICAASGVAP